MARTGSAHSATLAHSSAPLQTPAVSSPFREPHPPSVQPDPYLAAWRRFRQRRLAALGLCLAWIPTYSLVTAVGKLLLGNSFVVLVLGGLTPIALLAGVNLCFRAKCPNCNLTITKMGAGYARLSNPFTKACMNCGITIGTPRGAPGDRLEEPSDHRY